MTAERLDLQRTQDLVLDAKQGRRDALEALLARYRPRLLRWAAGRLPHSARSLLDTGDLVQETLIRSVESIGSIEAKEPGAFEGYLRRAVLNRIRDQIRWARRRAGTEPASETLVDPAPSPLEEAIGADVVRRYEDALALLSEEQRQLLHLRIELDLGYDEIAAVVGGPSVDATRMAIQRALQKLAYTMGHRKRLGRTPVARASGPHPPPG